MIGTRALGLNHVYLDENIDGFSNLAAGLLIRAVGHGLKVAYVDVLGKATRFTNFLENLSLSHFFIKRFDRLHIETFVFKADKVQKGIIPLVEFFTITSEMFWSSLNNNYDLIIIDNVSFSKISKFKILNFLSSKNPNTELVFTFSSKKEFDTIKDNFDLVSEYVYMANKKLISNKNIINITGDGKGKSTYSFGYILRNFINKKDVKLIYFDKGGDFYGERVFFDALKKWSKENSLYGRFDYVRTGLRRFDGQKFRFVNTQGDIREAKEGLMLLETALKKQTPVIAEELNTTVQTGLLSIDEIIKTLKEAENELLITGRYSPKQILDISSIIIDVKEVKHYSKKGHGVRKGIDF